MSVFGMKSSAAVKPAPPNRMVPFLLNVVAILAVGHLEATALSRRCCSSSRYSL